MRSRNLNLTVVFVDHITWNIYIYIYTRRCYHCWRGTTQHFLLRWIPLTTTSASVKGKSAERPIFQIRHLGDMWMMEIMDNDRFKRCTECEQGLKWSTTPIAGPGSRMKMDNHICDSQLPIVTSKRLAEVFLLHGSPEL